MGESSSDDSFDTSDDDIYTNSVARLKALRNKEKAKAEAKRIEKASEVLSTPIEIPDVDEQEIASHERDLRIEINDTLDSLDVEDSRSSDSSNRLIDDDMQITDIYEKNAAASTAQPQCVESIVLDPSDSDDEPILDVSKSNLSETENYSIEVKILWRSQKVVRLDMRMYEPFQTVFDYFSKLENVPMEQILLLRKEKPIKPTDTPVSLGISVIDIIDGGVMDTKYVDDQSNRAEDSDEDVCKIKLQMSQKESIMISLQKSHPFKFAILQCATKLNVPESKVKLYFDGDVISPNDTPESLDFEDEACIDVKIIS